MNRDFVALHLPEEEEMAWLAADALTYDYFSTNSKYSGEVFEELYMEHGMGAEEVLPEEVFYELEQEDLAAAYHNYEPYPEAYDEEVSKEYAGKRISFTR